VGPAGPAGPGEDQLRMLTAPLSPASRRGRDRPGLHGGAANPLTSGHLSLSGRTCCRTLPHFPMEVDYGESRHFCDDPVCPDPVRKLSMKSSHDMSRPPSQRSDVLHCFVHGVDVEAADLWGVRPANENWLVESDSFFWVGSSRSDPPPGGRRPKVARVPGGGLTVLLAAGRLQSGRPPPSGEGRPQKSNEAFFSYAVLYDVLSLKASRHVAPAARCRPGPRPRPRLRAPRERLSEPDFFPAAGFYLISTYTCSWQP